MRERKTARVSIIVPLYNAEKYLEESLQSILRQTYTDFEVICINDASEDATMDILRRFQSLDKRIKIVENVERSGAAISRNKGIHAAEGNYITFLDGDDIFEEEMLELACQAMEKHNTDIVIYEYAVASNEQIYEKKKIARTSRFTETFCKKPFSILDYEPIEFAQWSFSPWNKLYRKEFIYANHLEFQSLSSCNDVFFSSMSLFLSKSTIVLEDNRAMIYVRDHNEVTRISHDRDPMCCYLAMEKLGRELVARGVFSKTFQYYYYTLFYRLRGALLITKRKDNAESFYHFLQREGIKELKNLDSHLYSMVDDHIRGLLEKFIELDFSTAWYQYESIFAFYLYKNTEKLIDLLHTNESCGKETALWGAGVNGKAFLDFLSRHNLKIAEVADRDERKLGTVIQGYKVRKPEEVLKKVQIVIVCTLSLYADVIAETEKENIEVISLDEYLEV